MIKIPICKTYFDEKYSKPIIREIKTVLRTGILTDGPYLRRFEDAFKSYVGAKYSIGVNSGTSALEIILRYLNIKRKEVIVPSLTFISTANAVIFAGGKPIFAEISSDTLCLDPASIQEKITPKTKAVILVHIAGLITPQINSIVKLCQDNNIFLIEDACQAHGAMIDNKKAGNIGDAAGFSFYPSKVMATGEGGMITTNDPNLDSIGRSLRFHGIGEDKTIHVRLGYNWRLPEISAILGIYQLKQLEYVIGRRSEIANKYLQKIENVKEITPIGSKHNIRKSYYRFPVILSEEISREHFQSNMLEKHGIDIRSLYYPPIHLQPLYRSMFGYKEGMLPVTENITNRVVCLPIFSQMTDNEIENVVESVKEEIT